MSSDGWRYIARSIWARASPYLALQQFDVLWDDSFLWITINHMRVKITFQIYIKPFFLIVFKYIYWIFTKIYKMITLFFSLAILFLSKSIKWFTFLERIRSTPVFNCRSSCFNSFNPSGAISSPIKCLIKQRFDDSTDQLSARRRRRRRRLTIIN